MLILSFAAIAIFGAFAMDHNGSHGSYDCIAAAVGVIDCPIESGLIQFLNFHLEILKNFSLATFGTGVVLPILLISALLYLWLILFFDADFQQTPIFNSWRRRFGLKFLPQNRKLNHWLAIHENSPCLF